MIIPISQVPSVNDSLSSPPQYNHIEHQLKQSQSHEMYTKLQQSSPSAFSACSTFSTFATPEYEKLTHSSHIIHSNTMPVFTTKLTTTPPPSSVPSAQPEPLYSTLKEVEGEGQDAESTEGDDAVTTMSDDIPPPIPPRLSKMTSI